MSSPLVYLIILSWNGRELTEECLHSCAQIDYQNLKVVVVDNGSTDDLEGYLKSRFPALPVLRSEHNLGFAGGNNLGIRYALAHGADYVWLLNNDTIVDAKVVSAVVRIGESRPDAGIFGSKIYLFDRPDYLNTAGGVINWRTGQPSLIGYGEKDDGRFDAVREVDTVSGCSLFIKRKVIEAVGVMDERFFLYFEESDWVVRGAKAGYQVLYVPESKVWHKVSATTGGHESATMKYYMTRNNLLFMKKNVSGNPYRLFLCNYLLNLMPREILRMLLKNKDERLLKAKGILIGLLHYFTGRFGKYSLQK